MVSLKDAKKIAKPRARKLTSESEIIEAKQAIISVIDKKDTVTQLAWDHIEERLRLKGKDANSLAKMVLEPHFPKVKVNINAKIETMDRKSLIQHMKGLLNGK